MFSIRIALVGLVALLSFSTIQLTPARAEDKPASPASQPAAKAQPIDFRKLKEFMPEEAAGVKRSSHDGENMNIGDMAMTKASADYTKPDSDGSDAHANIEVVDYGAAPQMVAGMTAWRTVPVNIENDEGYQRTAKFKDYPAFQIYAKDGESRQMILLVSDRFLVTIQAGHVSEANFKKLTEGLPWDKLTALGGGNEKNAVKK